MLDDAICSLRGVYFVAFIIFLMEMLSANTVDSDPHHVTSDLGLHYLPLTLFFLVRLG